MKIIETNVKDPLKVYSLCKSKQNGRFVDEEDGSIIEISAFALFEDVNKKTNDTVIVLCVETSDGDILATASPTFIESFMDFVHYANEINYNLSKITIKIIHRVSNAGRDFITCDPVL